MFNVDNEINELIDSYNESVELEIAVESYNAIFDELQNRVNSGELTLEDAEILNDLAYNRYFSEDKSDIPAHYKEERDAQKFRSEKKMKKDSKGYDKYNFDGTADEDLTMMGKNGITHGKKDISARSMLGKQTITGKKISDKINVDRAK